MTRPTTYSFTRYLAAKKSVDNRALNQHVRQSLVAALSPATPGAPLRVLEVGAGIGTMIERLLAWDLLTNATYTAIDTEPNNIVEARRRLPRWAADQEFSVTEENHGRLRLQRRAQNLSVELEAIDLFYFMAREQGQRTWDLLIAQAFLDLVDVPTTLPVLLSRLQPGGLFYFTITFDGATIFQPELDPEFDAQIETLYQQTMDQRTTAGDQRTTAGDQRTAAGKPSGDSRTGRHLFGHLQTAGAELLDAGSSDWVVFAGPNGYPADEAYFLHFIIHTIHTALEGHPQLDAKRFAAWVEQRHTQVEQDSLIYIAHQLDFLGRLHENPFSRPHPIPLPQGGEGNENLGR